MKKYEYRTALADAEIFADTIRYLVERSDGFMANADEYQARAQRDMEENGSEAPDAYLMERAAECESKAFACDRLIKLLTK